MGVCWKFQTFSAVKGPNWESFRVSYSVRLCCFWTTGLRSSFLNPVSGKHLIEKSFTEWFQVSVKILANYLAVQEKNWQNTCSKWHLVLFWIYGKTNRNARLKWADWERLTDMSLEINFDSLNHKRCCATLLVLLPVGVMLKKKVRWKKTF